MVTAGVYLLLKLKILLIKSYLLSFIILFSLFTILFSGLSGFFQSDIKKIIAFSTSAQLAYMFLAIGLSQEFGFFHLLTHGFFKALLFLLAGVIIHSFLDNQDIRKFGNIIFLSPLSYSYFIVGTLTILSFPFLSGYYSKEIILEFSFINSFYIYLISLFGTFLTLLYSLKLLYFIYFSNFKSSISLISYFHFTPSYLFIILFPLVLGSLFLGYIFSDYFIGAGLFIFDFEFIPYYIKLLPTLLLISSTLLFILYYTFRLNINIFNKLYKYLIQSFSLHLFFDSFVNQIFVSFFSFFGYHFSFKFIDRGFLEFFILSFFRFLSYFSK